jgi:Tol biopolymer transport system component/DNA-binding winged helix-turn-helix (wHTH) protein
MLKDSWPPVDTSLWHPMAAMLMPKVQGAVRFGDFELDLRACQLRRKGQPIRLERRPMDLLIFLVERHGELVTRTDIVDQLWGRDVFIEVEPAVNTAVKKIRRALGDSPEASLFVETVPGRGYRFVAAVTPTTEWPRESFDPVGRIRVVVTGLAMIAMMVAGWAWWSRSQGSHSGPMQVVALTTLNGMERGATFSPDGRQISFTWNGEGEDNWDLYTKVIGSPDVRRLTTHPDRDLTPRWSFDGRQIAYIRQHPSGEIEHLRVMSALGGSDRQITALNVVPAHSWSPDDQWIAVGVPNQRGTSAGIQLIPVNGGEPRRLTQALAGGIDWMTAFSPDGSRLAYGSCANFMSTCHVFVVTLDAEYRVSGQSRRLTTTPVESIRGLTWSRDGASVIYGAIRTASSGLWRADASGGIPPERIELAGNTAMFPAAALAADRLAFTRGILDEDVYALEASGSARPIARSSVFDGHAKFSPDGSKVAFCSDRTSDATEVWLASADGSHAEQLTRGPGRFQCAPSWSPDGKSIAFESRDANGESQIYAIGVDVRQPALLTTGRGDRRMPSWSRTGEWIYFSSDQGTGRDIWRVRRDGGSPERVTESGSGLAGAEAADGATLLYLGPRPPRLHEPVDAPLLARSLGGGAAREVISCVRGTAFSVVAEGVYYVPCRTAPGDARDPEVRLLHLAAGRERSVGTLVGYEHRMPSGFSASPDGRMFLYNRLAGRGEDLMLIENFR